MKPDFISLPPPPCPPSLRASMEKRTFGADFVDPEGPVVVVVVVVVDDDDSFSLTVWCLDVFDERISSIFSSAWGYLERRVSLES